MADRESICAIPLAKGSMRGDAMPPPSSAPVMRKLKPWIPGTAKRSDVPFDEMREVLGHPLLHQRRIDTAGSSDRRAMTPMFAVSPLSPLRA